MQIIFMVLMLSDIWGKLRNDLIQYILEVLVPKFKLFKLPITQFVFSVLGLVLFFPGIKNKISNRKYINT